MKHPVPVVYAHASGHIGGGNKVMLRLLEGLDRRRYRPFSLVPFSGPMEGELRALDVPYRVVEMRTQDASLWKTGGVLLKLALHIRQMRPRLLHAAETVYHAVSLAAPATLRLCHYHHCMASTEQLAWLFRRPPDWLLCPSMMVQQNLQHSLAPLGLAPPLRVAYPPIDVEWFRPPPDRQECRVKLGLDPAQPQISIVGALAGHKGHRCFLQAARLVLLSQPGARFNIVGDETGRTHGYRDELRVLAEQLGVSAAVKFWGFVDDVVARDLMAASDVLIAASREEGFGMTLAEAQACETPVVASRIQPFDEVIVDGRSGHLVELDNAAEFARRTLELINDEARRRQMGKAGREWVRSRFGIASYVEQMNEDYDQLLGARDAMAS